MAKRLDAGTRLVTILNKELRIVEELDSGPWATVYSASYEGRLVAFKWYGPDALCIQTQRVKDPLRLRIVQGPPSRHFLWVLDEVERNDGAFGYVMDLLPEEYVCVTDILLHPSWLPSYRRAIDACLRIVLAFASLHDRDLCFQEVSASNFYVDPRTGEVLITVENDIVSVGTQPDVLGSPRFMAPEVNVDRVAPSIQSDLHSMAVLVFMLLCRQHPLEGMRLTRDSLINANWQRRTYGTDPVFIFDPDNTTNRPDPAFPHASYVWPYLPRHAVDFLCHAFSQESLHHPMHRPSEREWLRELARLRSEVVVCHCGNEVFLDSTEPTRCDRCGALCGAPLRMEVGAYRFVVANDVRIYRCQLKPLCDTSKMPEPQLQVVTPKYDPWNVRRMGLRNVSGESWKARLDGREVDVAPGKIVRAAEGLELEVLDMTVRICANSIAAKPDGPSARDLYVFYVLDRSIDVLDGGNFSNCVVQDTLYELRRLNEEDKRLRVRVAALAYDRSFSWLVSDGLVALEEFEVKPNDLNSCQPGCTLGWALQELDAMLSGNAKRFAEGNSMILVVFALNGHCNNLMLIDYPRGYDQILQNEWFARSARFLFVPNMNNKAEALAKITHDGRATLTEGGSVSGYAGFHSFLDRLRGNPEWELTSGYLALSDVVRLALWRCGSVALRDPKVLRVFLRDRMRAGSDAADVMSQAGSALLEPLLRVYAGSTGAEEAKANMVRLLKDERNLKEDLLNKMVSELVRGVEEALRDNERYALRPSGVPACLTVLREDNRVAPDGSRCLAVLVRNDADKTLWVDMTAIFHGTDDCVVGTGWGYVVVAPGDVSLLYLTSKDFGIEDGRSMHAAYKLMARESPYEALSAGLVIEPEYFVDDHRRVFVLRNDGSTDAYVECVRVYAVWHEADAQDSRSNPIQELWRVESFHVRSTLAPGDTQTLLSNNNWIMDPWEAFTVGGTFPKHGDNPECRISSTAHSK